MCTRNICFFIAINIFLLSSCQSTYVRIVQDLSDDHKFSLFFFFFPQWLNEKDDFSRVLRKRVKEFSFFSRLFLLDLFIVHLVFPLHRWFGWFFFLFLFFVLGICFFLSFFTRAFCRILYSKRKTWNWNHVFVCMDEYFKGKISINTISEYFSSIFISQLSSVPY